MTKPQVIEIFHLAFLQVLPTFLPASAYAVKGGANLRLFLDSVRRSEDIDLNYIGGEQWSLQSRMDAAFASKPLVALLAQRGVKIIEAHPSKTTTTTGRWKFTLSGPGANVNSKVEFSMRGEDRPLFEMSPVSREIATASGMRQAVANHYLPTGAVEQKIAALAFRTETQSRDIFDLDYLFTRYSSEAAAAMPDRQSLDLARRRVFEVGYAEYQALVLPFLDPAMVSMYRGEDEWERIALHVSTTLDAMWDKSR
jgi:hypothetical protein